MRVLRPLEWVLLAFVAWVLIQAGVSALGALTPAVVGRSLLILMMMVLVNAGLLTQAARAEPWANPDDARRERFKRLLPLALTPMVVVAGLIAFALPSQQQQADSGALMHAITTFATGFTVSSPFFLIWLALWRDAKRHPELQWGRFFKVNGAAVVDTARDWAPLALIISGYAWMGAVMDLKPVQGADQKLIEIDRMIFGGHDPVIALQAIINRPLSEWLSFAYAFFAPLYPITLGALTVAAGRQAFRQTAFALGLGLVLAYVSYGLMPAKGPVFVQEFTVPLGVEWTQGIKAALMDETRITWDCFPSMHTTATLVMGAGLYRHARKAFFVLLPIIASIPFACVYLRYHYVIDVLVAFPYAALLVLVSRKVEPDQAAKA
jgi:membrane-associated phospholipid phosphatase